MAYEILCGLAVLLLAIYYYFWTAYNFWRRLGVKGPRPVPLVGNLGPVFLGKESIGNLLKNFYNQFYTEPFVGIYAGFEPTLILRDQNVIKDVLIKDFSVFADRGVLTSEVDPFSANLFTIDGVRWRPLRKEMSPVFTSGKLKDMFYLLGKCADNFEQNLMRAVDEAEDGVINCREVTSRFTANVIATCAFGIEINAGHQETCEFLDMGNRLINPSFKRVVKDKIREIMPWLYPWVTRFLADTEVVNFFVDIVSNTLKYRKEKGVVRNDFMDFLLHMADHPEKFPGIELSDKTITAQAVVFFLAGFHSSSGTMSHIMYELALNPHIQQKLRDEIMTELKRTGGVIEYDGMKKMEYLDAVFKEILRKYSPVMFLMRKSVKEYTFAGTNVTIPKGQKIWIPVNAVHSDPAFYPDPEIFDPERFTGENMESANSMTYLAFGDGPRNCIGTRLAMTQTKVGVIKMLKNYKVDVCSKTMIPYTTLPRSFILTPKQDLCVKLTRINED